MCINIIIFIKIINLKCPKYLCIWNCNAHNVKIIDWNCTFIMRLINCKSIDWFYTWLKLICQFEQKKTLQKDRKIKCCTNTNKYNTAQIRWNRK